MDNVLYDFAIPGVVAIAEVVNGLPKVVLTHASGSSAEVYLHGAHIASWKNASGEELFFMSRESWFEQGKPIRGGIPVIFPQFGKTGPLPQHGIARTGDWQLVKTQVLEEGGVAVQLQLTENADTLAVWPHRFALMLGVILEEDSLTVEMLVENTDDVPFSFQTALHTYFRVADITRTALHGLHGVTFIDTIAGNARETETRSFMQFEGETDRVYVDAPDSLRLDDEGDGRSFAIETTNMPDVVVWNPWIEKSAHMTDFGGDEYKRMVCVETGRIASPCELMPGERWQGETIFTC